MDEPLIKMELSGHDLLILKMAIEGELEFWHNLKRHDMGVDPQLKRPQADSDRCIADLKRLGKKVSYHLEKLPLAEGKEPATGTCND